MEMLVIHSTFVFQRVPRQVTICCAINPINGTVPGYTDPPSSDMVPGVTGLEVFKLRDINADKLMA